MAGVGLASFPFVISHMPEPQQGSQTSACGSCLLGGCYGLNKVLTPNTLHNVMAIEDRAFKEVIKVNLGHVGGP